MNQILVERIPWDLITRFRAGTRFLLDDIPADLWAEVQAKSTRDGVTIRAVFLMLLREWVNGARASLRPYLQHHAWCQALTCGRCQNSRTASVHLDHQGNPRFHKFIVVACSCGLDALLAPAGEDR